MTTRLKERAVQADYDPEHDDGGEPLVGTQLRFATSTIKKRMSGQRERQTASRPLFGNQIRFAVRTIRNAIDRRRSHPRAAHHHN